MNTRLHFRHILPKKNVPINFEFAPLSEETKLSIDIYHVSENKEIELLNHILVESLSNLTSDEIWVLYEEGVSPGPDMELSGRMFVFDYNGKPLRSYHLEYPVSSFCIDENTHTLYGLSESPEICIIKFDLDK